MQRYKLFIQIAFLTLISSNVLADWEKVSTNHHGSFFINFETITSDRSYIYYWDLGDLNSPIGEGYLSVKSYNKGNCAAFSRKPLKNSFHKKPMARDIGRMQKIENKNWVTPPKNSSTEKILKAACNYVK